MIVNNQLTINPYSFKGGNFIKNNIASKQYVYIKGQTKGQAVTLETISFA
jgi:hypothetical protein